MRFEKWQIGEYFMRAMVLSQPGQIETRPLVLTELPTPTPAKNEILVQVEVCAVCRTDLHVIEGDLRDPKLPLIPGHQVIGKVVQNGEGATRFSLGERVGIAWLRKTCGMCNWCTTGRENLCEGSLYTGYHVDGGYAEFAVVDQDYAYKIPPQVDSQYAAPLLCAGIIGFRALKRCNLPTNGNLGIVGFGSSAHITLQVAKQRGYKVFVTSRGSSHVDLARSIGAVWAGPSDQLFPEKLDGVIVFAPSGSVVPDALRSIKKGGRVVMAGIHSTPVPELNYNECLFHEKELTSVEANTRQDGIELFAESKAVTPHTTHFKLEQANDALLALKQDKINGTALLMIN